MRPRPRILVVEDEAKTAAVVGRYLEGAGFAVELVTDGTAGLSRAASGEFALVVLDRMLPGMDGRTLCRRLREGSRVPIVMLTALAAEDERIEGLEQGADDYVAKPFSPRELVARVRAVLRRAEPEGLASRRSWNGLVVDLERAEARRDSQQLSLTATELRLLWTLLGAPGRVFSREEIMERVLGPEFAGSERTVDAHVRNLRRKLEPEPARPRYLATVFGRGYRLAAKGDR